MRWLITGGAGMLANDLLRRLTSDGEDVLTLSRADLDIRNGDAVAASVREFRPDVIVNCAAFTKVDDCETEEELATAINGHSVGHLAAAANDADALLVQVSTDFVFSGDATVAYEHDDAPSPISAYGRSKLVGEQAAAEARRHQIVRTSWLFGRDGWNFVEAIRKQIDMGRSELSVVDDQRGKPTYTPHLAAAIVHLARASSLGDEAMGVFHYADAPEVTWHGFATRIVEEMTGTGVLEREVIVHPVTTDAFPRPARRPAWSVLSTTRWEGVTGRLPADWRDGLREYLAPGRNGRVKSEG